MSGRKPVRPAAEVADEVYTSLLCGNGNISAGRIIERDRAEVRAAFAEKAIAQLEARCASYRRRGEEAVVWATESAIEVIRALAAKEPSNG